FVYGPGIPYNTTVSSVTGPAAGSISATPYIALSKAPLVFSYGPPPAVAAPSGTFTYQGNLVSNVVNYSNLKVGMLINAATTVAPFTTGTNNATYPNASSILYVPAGVSLANVKKGMNVISSGGGLAGGGRTV